MPLIYTLFIRIYGWIMQIAALFNGKARKWVDGRKSFRDNLKSRAGNARFYYWVHCASAGEFEQAIPIITILRERFPDRKIAVSFFSPSGFELYNGTAIAHLFFYFPLDTYSNARAMLEILQPTCAVFIRNEIWLNTLTVLKEKNIPAYLVNAPAKQKRNFFYQYYLNYTYPLFTKVIDTTKFGNTKLERVLNLRDESFDDAVFKTFCRPENVIIILGSSWHEEEKMMAAFYSNYKSVYPQLKIIIAPHEFDAAKKSELSVVFNEEINTYSNFQSSNSRILFLDRKGILKHAYRYAQLAFIGGGFGKSVHNVNEAAVYGIPALFGPHYKKFEEIEALVDLNVAYPVEDDKSFKEKLKALIESESLRLEIKENLHAYFSTQENTSEKIVDAIMK